MIATIVYTFVVQDMPSRLFAKKMAQRDACTVGRASGKKEKHNLM